MMCFRKNKKGLADSAKAVAEADKNLKRVKSRSEEVHQVSEALKTIRERNHFAEQLEALLGGGTR